MMEDEKEESAAYCSPLQLDRAMLDKAQTGFPSSCSPIPTKKYGGERPPSLRDLAGSTSILSSLSVSPIQKTSQGRDDAEEEREEVLSPRSVAVVDDPTTAWRSPRWKELHEKRSALRQKRVQLEQRLVEATTTASSSATTAAPLPRPSSLPPCRFVVQGATVEWSGAIDTETHLPTGFGTLIIMGSTKNEKDGQQQQEQVYKGRVVAGLRHGAGKNVWIHKGQTYTGEWSEGRRSGRGTHTWPDGKTVTGQWVAGQLHGHVHFRWPDGATYDGETVRGRQQGRGTLTSRHGSVYQGEFFGGYQDGFGTLHTVAGQQYRGQFRRGQRHGHGVQIWSTKTYEGEWQDNAPHGRGKLVWRETGAVYEGDFHRGQFHGLGYYRTFSGVKRYEGEWFHGARQGRGMQRWSDNRVYYGSFRQNQRHGYGQMVYLDGSSYTGGWADGQRSGLGLEILGEDGRIGHCGLWKNNRPVVAQQKSSATGNNNNVSTDEMNTTNRTVSLLIDNCVDGDETERSDPCISTTSSRCLDDLDALVREVDEILKL